MPAKIYGPLYNSSPGQYTSAHPLGGMQKYLVQSMKVEYQFIPLSCLNFLVLTIFLRLKPFLMTDWSSIIFLNCLYCKRPSSKQEQEKLVFVKARTTQTHTVTGCFVSRGHVPGRAHDHTVFGDWGRSQQPLHSSGLGQSISLPTVFLHSNSSLLSSV